MYINDILSMPDKWEYPWFATWDTAFHCIPLAMVDPGFAKKQLDLMTREWYMKPDGALPAYEWNFSDVNPPVHAWATFRVFKIERKFFGREDLDFLERVFHKLLLNFPWLAALTLCRMYRKRCLTYLGGSIEKMPTVTMSLRAVSWVWTILAPSTVPSPCQRVASCVRRTVPLGWPFSV